MVLGTARNLLWALSLSFRQMFISAMVAGGSTRGDRVSTARPSSRALVSLYKLQSSRATIRRVIIANFAVARCVTVSSRASNNASRNDGEMHY